MKRTLALVLCLVLLLSVSASATTTDDSEKRNAFEFCELFTERIDDTFEKYGYEWEAPSFSYHDSSVMEMGANARFVTTAAGSVTVSTDTFRINDGIFLYMDLDADTEENFQHLLECCVAISALEYGRDEVMKFELENLLDSSVSTDPVARAIDLWSESVEPILNSKKSMVAILNGSYQVVYTGKYTYYLSYSESEGQSGNATKYFYVHALSAQ